MLNSSETDDRVKVSLRDKGHVVQISPSPTGLRPRKVWAWVTLSLTRAIPIEDSTIHNYRWISEGFQPRQAIVLDGEIRTPESDRVTTSLTRWIQALCC